MGDHVTQKGSLVSFDRLRFDFSHHKKLSNDEINTIESKVNNIINSSYPVTTQSMKPEDAIEKGALALFGEKYEDEVRVLSIGPENGKAYSVELCGGTHAKNTNEIGKFKITSNSSVAAGIRRIEALIGYDIETFLLDQKQKYKDHDELIKKKEAKNNKLNEDKKLLEEMINKQISNTSEKLIIIELCQGIKAKDLRGLIDKSKKKIKKDGIIIIIAQNENKLTFLIGVTEELSNTISAVEIAEYASSISGGRGAGGRKDFAQSGGNANPDKTRIDDIKKYIESKIDV